MPSPEPVRISWNLDSPAAPEAVWEVFSDTDTYNRIVGFGYQFQERPLDDGAVERTGTTQVFGMKLTWDEQPFEYRKNEWYRIRRRFRSGPATDLVVTLRLAPDGEGTRIRYTIEVTPRSVFTRPLVGFELKGRTRKQTDAGLQKLLAQVALPKHGFGIPAPALGTEASQRLQERLSAHTDLAVAEQLGSFIRDRPLHTQIRIQPLALAVEWSLSPERVVKATVEAARRGVLDMQWDLLCPLCQGPKLRQKRLRAGPLRVHCTSCNISYDGTMPDAIAVTFRPAEDIRTFSIAPACIGSPSNQPHVIAQDSVAPGATRSLEFSAAPGAYRVRTLPPSSTARLLVVADSPEASPTLSVHGEAMEPSELRVSSAHPSIVVHNTGDRLFTVVIDRRTLPAQTLTAGTLLGMESMLEEIPAESLPEGARIERTHSVNVLLALEPGATSADFDWTSSGWEGASVRRSARRVLARFPDRSGALAALAGIAGDPRCRAAMCAGDVVTFSIDESGDLDSFFGPSFDWLSRHVDDAPAGTLVSPSGPEGDTEGAGWHVAPARGDADIMCWTPRG